MADEVLCLFEVRFR